MNKFVKLLNKSERVIIGTLSGTSMDGVDVVLTRINGNNVKTDIQVIDFYTNPYPDRLKELVLKSTGVNTSNVEIICKLNFYLGIFFAESINKLLSINNTTSENIDLIGSHGQTVFHIPEVSEFLNFKTKSTLQLGEPSVIANLTGITTIGDFRVADVAVGGDGAPLVPFLDYILYHSNEKSRILLNIGGIANLTYLKKNSGINEMVAFDTGPGNVLIDSVTKLLFNKEFDKNGEIANSGKINDNLLNFIKEKDIFLKISPPKSTGREHYNLDFVNDIISYSEKISPEDILRTVTEYTVHSVKVSIERFIKDNLNISEIFVSGGGSYNDCLMKSMSDNMSGLSVTRFDHKGITPENKEAVLFAVLANEAIQFNSANIKSVTNAKKNIILGKICIAN